MAEPHTAPQDPNDTPQFSAVLTPHRSLGPKGFMVFMGLVSTVSFGTGLLFYMMGAWPVMGFMGLDERVGRMSELSLVSHGKRLVLGSFLTDPEREDFAAALKAAISTATSPN